MKVLINYPENPNKDIKAFHARVKTYLKSKSGVEVIENRDVSKPAEYALIINIGYDYRIIAETFKILTRFNIQNPTKLVFLNPAGDGWYKEFNILAQKAIDDMGCEPRIFEYVEDFWSVNNFEKSFDFFHKSVVDTSEKK